MVVCNRVLSIVFFCLSCGKVSRESEDGEGSDRGPRKSHDEGFQVDFFFFFPFFPFSEMGAGAVRYRCSAVPMCS